MTIRVLKGKFPFITWELAIISISLPLDVYCLGFKICAGPNWSVCHKL